MTEASQASGEANEPRAKREYLHAPRPSTHMPAGIPYIVGNEAAERFSFYGMRAILVVFMTKHLLSPDRTPQPMDPGDALVAYHTFLGAVYFFPLLGGLLADVFLGKYRTIVALSIVYCFGHLALALDHTRLGLLLGLGLIALGSGGIKPCVSAHVGDQFGTANRHLLEKVFGWFYFSVNLGAFASTLLTPTLLTMFGPDVAFGVPGVLMLLATIVFWSGRYKFVHVPAGGWDFVRDVTNPRNLAPVLRLLPLFLFVTVFWVLYDQSGSAWVLQAEKMDRYLLGFEIHPAQVQAINPALIMLYVPLFAYVVYPLINRVWPLTPLRKINIGLFLTSLSFVVPALVEQSIASGYQPHILWQWLAFAILTAAETMVSVTCLEFSYTQAPRRMKSLVMSLYYLSVSLGNLFTGAFNHLIARLKEQQVLNLSGANYYWFFVGLMAAAAVGFAFYARGFKEQVVLQDEP